MTTIYGIKNCDTMKKARAWLEAHKVVYEFHDYKTQGIDRARLEKWVRALGWETLLNRAGTTFLQDCRTRTRKASPKESHRPDAGPAFHGQAPGDRDGRQTAGGFQAG